MPIYLLVAATVILACIACNRISGRLGVPRLLIFILLGMCFGTDGLFKIDFDNFAAAEQICSVALIFIMFYGGFGTKWSEARPVAGKAALLATVGVVLTAGLTGLFCRFALRLPWTESLLLGSVISSTDAASVFSILRSKRLNLRDGTASLLEVESGSNDPFSYMLTVLSLTLMRGSLNGGAVAYLLFAQVVYGAAIGAALGLLASWLLQRLRFSTDGFDAVFVFAVALLAYAVPAAIGGNGYLSAYIAGMILGNRRLRNKKSLVHFFDGATELMQMLVFFLLGLLSFPSRLPSVAPKALLVALFLTVVARPLTVWALLTPFRCPLRQQALISLAGLRGAASIVFAVMAMNSGLSMGLDLFHIVFFIVLFSILLQGILLPRMARKLDMIDSSADVLRTFTDYTEEMPVECIQFTLEDTHPWVGQPVRELPLPPETLLVQLRRGGARSAPMGDTILRGGDTLLLSARSPAPDDGLELSELRLDARHEWTGKTLLDAPLEPGQLVVLILRSGRVLIPNGQTVLEPDDVLLLSRDA